MGPYGSLWVLKHILYRLSAIIIDAKSCSAAGVLPSLVQVNSISSSFFHLRVIWGQLKFDKSQLVTGFNKKLNFASG